MPSGRTSRAWSDDGRRRVHVDPVGSPRLPQRHAGLARHVAGDAAEGADSRFGEGEDRDVRALGERSVVESDDDRDERLRQLGLDLQQRVRGERGEVGQRRGEDDDEGVDLVRGQQRAHRVRVVGRHGPVGELERPALHRRAGGQRGQQLVDQVDAERGRRQPLHPRRVEGEEGRADRVGDDHDAVAARQGRAGQHPGGVEQLAHRVDADHAGLLVERRRHGIAPKRRRGRRRSACGGTGGGRCGRTCGGCRSSPCR